MKDLKLENSVLSTFLSNNDLFVENLKNLNEGMFSGLNHKMILGVMMDLIDKGLTIDLDVVESSLNSKKNVSIDVYDYTNPLNIYNIESFIIKLKELQFKRSCINLSNKLLSESKNEFSDVFDINSNLNKEVLKLSEVLASNVEDDNSTLVRKAIKEIEFAKQNQGVTGCKTGFHEIDKLTGGWQRGHLVILAARPAMGKTSLAICQALNGAIDHGENILFFSLEMSGTELMKRQLSLRSNISLTDLSNDRDISFKDLHKGATPIIKKGFKLIDNCFSLYQIKAQCRKENNSKKLSAIYIDYLQLIKHVVDKGRSKENEVSEISRELKLLAKELNTPVICLSQLSRAVESRGGNKIPQLSDLRDSGSIEQDADIVNFIYRPEYYGIDQDDNGDSTKGVAIIKFAKNRHGPTDDITLFFNAGLTKFSDYTTYNSDNLKPIEPSQEWIQ